MVGIKCFRKNAGTGQQTTPGKFGCLVPHVTRRSCTAKRFCRRPRWDHQPSEYKPRSPGHWHTLWQRVGVGVGVTHMPAIQLLDRFSSSSPLSFFLFERRPAAWNPPPLHRPPPAPAAHVQRRPAGGVAVDGRRAVPGRDPDAAPGPGRVFSERWICTGGGGSDQPKPGEREGPDPLLQSAGKILEGLQNVLKIAFSGDFPPN